MQALYDATPQPGPIALYAALLAWGALAHVVAAVSGLRSLIWWRERHRHVAGKGRIHQGHSGR